jgi:hypothetical protein
MKGAIALAVIGTSVISLFIMAMSVVAANHGKWDLADKWITMLFTSIVCNAFLGFLYVKANNQPGNQNN